MADVNQVTIEGRFGQQPTLTATPSGIDMCKCSIAWTKGKKDKAGNWSNETKWFNVLGFDKAAKAMAMCKKGDKVMVSGSLSASEWEKDGQKRTSYDIIVYRISLVQNAWANEIKDIGHQNFDNVGPAPMSQAPDNGWLKEEDVPF